MPPQLFACSLKLLKRVGTRPETMPAHTQTWRAKDKHTDRQMSADNTESFLLRQTPSCFTAGPRLTLDFLCQTPSCFTAGPRIDTGLPVPDPFLLHSWALIDTGLPASQQGPGLTLDFLHQTPSCFTAGPRIHTGLPAPDTFLLHSRAPDSPWTFPVLPETMPAHTQTRKAKD